MSGRQAGFARSSVAVLVAVAIVSFLLAFVLAAFGDDLNEPQTAGSNSFSTSALGHRGLLEFLERSGIDVRQRRSTGTLDLGDERALLVLEPPIESFEQVLSLFELAELCSAPFVLALPKWFGEPMTDKPRWVKEVFPVPRSMMETRLNGLLAELELDELGVPRDTELRRLECTAAGGRVFQVELDAPQLLHPSEQLAPLLECDGKVLIGELTGEYLYAPFHIVSDPDLVNNQGLARGDHAAIIAELLLPRLGVAEVVVDETIHGFTRRTGLVRELLRFPLVFSVLQGLLVIGIVVWSGTGRFGKPIPVAPRIQDGTRTLMDNAAQLLCLGGRSVASLGRYFEATLRTVGAHFFLPHDLPRSELIDRLHAISAARGGKIDLRQHETRIERLRHTRTRSAEREVKLAMQLYHWRQEMTDGVRRD